MVVEGTRPILLSLSVHFLLLATGFGLLLYDRSRTPYARLAEVSLESIRPAEMAAAPEPTANGHQRKKPLPRKPASVPQSAGNGAGSLPVAADELQVTEMPKLLSEVRIPYPEEARARGVEGTVKVDLLVDEFGVVRQSKVIEGPGYGLNEAALEAISGFKFTPAKTHEKPVAVRVRYSYRFVLDR